MSIQDIGLLSFNGTVNEKEIVIAPEKQPADVKKVFSPLFAQAGTLIKTTNIETEEATDLKGAKKHEWIESAKDQSNGRIVDILEKLFNLLYNLNNKETECENKKRPGDFTNADVKLKSDTLSKIGVIYDDLKRRAKEDPVKLYSQLNNEKKFERLFDIILVGSAQLKDYYASVYLYKGKKFIEEFGLSMARTVNASYAFTYNNYGKKINNIFSGHQKELDDLYKEAETDPLKEGILKTNKYKDLAGVLKDKKEKQLELAQKEYLDGVARLGKYYGRLIGAFYARVFEKVSPDTRFKIPYEAIKLEIKKETPDVEAGVTVGPANIKIKSQDKMSLNIDVIKLLDSIVKQLEHNKKCELIKEYGLEKPLAVININMSDKKAFDFGFYEGFNDYVGSYVNIVEEANKK